MWLGRVYQYDRGAPRVEIELQSYRQMSGAPLISRGRGREAGGNQPDPGLTYQIGDVAELPSLLQVLPTNTVLSGPSAELTIGRSIPIDASGTFHSVMRIHPEAP